MKILRIMVLTILITLSLATLYFMIQKTQEKERMFVFYLPWDDSSDTVTNFGDYLVKPAGSLGYAKIGEDGHIYFGNQRVRFLGVNIIGSSAFPDKDTADKVAKRLAKFGINIVRFHHLEAPWESFNILGKIEDGKRKLNPEALDKLDYFISKLEENGIYLDLNLLVSRKFSSKEGLPRDIDNMDFKDQHVLSFFDNKVLELEKEYAKQLLTHKNPYTNLTYAEDPAVVFVEIINENGLIQGWLEGRIDNLPIVFREELQNMWNEFLINKYGSTENLSKAWTYEEKGLLANESLENRTVRIIELKTFESKNPKIRRDWIDFLYSLEEKYFNEMYKFLKDELRVKALVIGTIVGCSTPNIMSKLDVVDTHAYWQHPVFLDIPWPWGSSDNWYVVNEPMINDPLYSTIQGLSFRRVYGKPFTVTEYNHPFPNMYGAETTILLSTYAALQDWDGIFFFTYDIRKDEKIGEYFDISEDPGKMATILIAHNLFVRGDLSPAKQTVTVNITSEEEKDLIVRGEVHAWALPDARYFGMKNEAPLIHKTAIITESSKAFVENLNFSQKISEEEKVFVSDNGQVIWNITDPAHGLLIVNTSRTVAAIGFSSNKLLKFKNIEITPGNSLLDGFSVIGVTVKEGEDLHNFKNLLLIAVGYSGNYKMEIRKYDARELIAIVDPNLREIERFNGRITCSWGNAPTLTEGIEAQIKIRTKENISVYALDNTGRRTKQIPVESEGELKIFKISPEYRTIWYEITTEK